MGQGTFKSPLPHPPAQHHNRTSCWIPTNSTSCIRKSTANPELSRKQCLSMSRTPPQLQPWKISTTTHLGPTSSIFTNLSAQANTTANLHCQHLTPPTGHLPSIPFPNPSFLPLLIKQGGIILFPFIFHYGKYTHPILTSPSLYLHLDLQQCHLGKFLYNILLV